MDYLLNCDKHYGLIVQPDSGSADYNYHEQLKTNILILDHHDIEAGQKLIQAGKLTISNQSTTQQEPKVQPKVQAVNPQVAKAKKAASLPSSRADKKTVIDYLDADGNIDMDSEEFNKAYAAFNAKLQRKY